MVHLLGRLGSVWQKPRDWMGRGFWVVLAEEPHTKVNKDVTGWVPGVVGPELLEVGNGGLW
jgi:hypothetical protein